MPINASVGEGGVNAPLDVQYVQVLLNSWGPDHGIAELAMDGLIGPKTNGAIRAFQQAELGFVDGLVEVGLNTITALEASIADFADELKTYSVLALALSYESPPDEVPVDEFAPLNDAELVAMFQRMAEG